MSYDKSSLLRKLVPKSYHFDGYNELNFPNSHNKPFYAEGTKKIGNYYLTTKLLKDDVLSLEYSSVCYQGLIKFKPYELTFENFIKSLRKALKENSDFITFEITADYWYADYRSYNPYYRCNNCSEKNAACSFLRKHKPNKLMAAVSFNIDDIKDALSVYFGINTPQTTPKGGNKMKGMEKLLGTNFEYGISKDPNISSTLMGVAVKNSKNGNWYVFDPATCKRTNISSMKMGDFPILLMPTTNLRIGTLIKQDNAYYFVQDIKPDQITLVGAADGFIQQQLPEENLILGMNIYTEVVAFDAKTLCNPNTKENLSGNLLAAIFLMQCSKGESEFSLDNISDDSFNGLGSYLPLLLALGNNAGSNNCGLLGENSSGFNLPMLMAFAGNDGNGNKNEYMQLLVLQQLLNNSSNPGSRLFPTLPGFINDGTSTTHPSEEVYCPKCNKTLPEGVNYCPDCGTKTELKTQSKICASCGAKLIDGAKFCHNCGKKVINEFCHNCGNRITPESKFCANCGTSVNATTPKPAVKKKTSTTKKKINSTPAKSTSVPDVPVNNAEEE